MGDNDGSCLTERWRWGQQLWTLLLPGWGDKGTEIAAITVLVDHDTVIGTMAARAAPYMELFYHASEGWGFTQSVWQIVKHPLPWVGKIRPMLDSSGNPTISVVCFIFTCPHNSHTKPHFTWDILWYHIISSVILLWPFLRQRMLDATSPGSPLVLSLHWRCWRDEEHFSLPLTISVDCFYSTIKLQKQNEWDPYLLQHIVLLARQ